MVKHGIIYHGSLWEVGRFPTLPTQDRIGPQPTLLVLVISFSGTPIQLFVEEHSSLSIVWTSNHS